jgi:hypothetical protein
MVLRQPDLRRNPRQGAISMAIATPDMAFFTYSQLTTIIFR